MRTVFVVDDERTFTDINFDNALYLRTEDEAFGVLARWWTMQYMAYHDPINELWLDHDLGPGGYVLPIAQWLMMLSVQDSPLKVDRIFVHSMNPVGAVNIVSYLDQHYKVERVSLPNCK